jgi:hypothetical protein
MMDMSEMLMPVHFPILKRLRMGLGYLTHICRHNNDIEVKEEESVEEGPGGSGDFRCIQLS